MLKCENRAYAQLALLSFYKKFKIHWRKKHQYTTHFEHGQLWIMGVNGSIHSVADAEGLGTVNGFDFELIENDKDN